MQDPEKVTYFGETDFRNTRTRFGIKRKDRTRHMYIIGKTGMGKSTLLENLAIQDIQNGEGLAFIDPHGSAAEKLLEFVPQSRINDVIYFAPFDLENPISFNVLEGLDEERKHLIAAGLMNAFKKIFVDGEGKSSFSGRMEYILSMTLLALLDNPGETILGINRMYSDKDFRKKIVNNIKDPSVKSFWVDEYAKYSEKFAQEATASIQNKIGQFAANPLIRNLMGQKESSFDFRQAMDDRKIIIVNLSKGKMGPDNMRLVGGMVVTKIYLAAMSRADASAKELKELAPFYLYVDEFQNFANESFAEILSESRKYNLALTVANQYIDQMTEAVRGAILGNVGSMVVFRIGAPDAEIMEKEFTPYFTAEDLVNLGFTQVYMKLMIDGVGSPPFSATSLDTLPGPEVSSENEIIENSRLKYCKPKKEVEANIAEWFAPILQANSVRTNTEAESTYKPKQEYNSNNRTDFKPKHNQEYPKRDKQESKPPYIRPLENNVVHKESPKYTQRQEPVAPIQKNQASSNIDNRVESDRLNNQKSESPLKDLLKQIQSGEAKEVVDDRKKEINPRIALSAIAADKSVSFSGNKNSLKEAIEKALKDSQYSKADSQKEYAKDISSPQVDNISASEKSEKVMTSNNQEKKEVPEDVLKNLLQID